MKRCPPPLSNLTRAERARLSRFPGLRGQGAGALHHPEYRRRLKKRQMQRYRHGVRTRSQELRELALQAESERFVAVPSVRRPTPKKRQGVKNSLTYVDVDGNDIRPTTGEKTLTNWQYQKPVSGTVEPIHRKPSRTALMKRLRHQLYRAKVKHPSRGIPWPRFLGLV